MRIGFFIGGGCPLAVQVSVGGKTESLIPEIGGLTKAVKEGLESDGALKTVAQTAWDRLATRGIAMPTVEDVLSHIRTLKSLCGNSGIDGFTADQLGKLDDAMCERIRGIVSKTLPASDTPYHILASWIQAIPRDKPVEIFTTNYDLLLEQALEEQRVPYFDGFVGSDSAFLDLESMAEDDLPARWARLWKIHGSINWWMTAERKIRRSRDVVLGEQLLIYPSHLKYDQSRQMPYYAMLDRLRVFLRADQCVLLTCGYSFRDEHINAYVGQGLAGNANAACFAMIFDDLANAPRCGPSYTSPAITTNATSCSSAAATRFSNACFVASRSVSARRASPRRMPVNGVSRWRSAACRKRNRMKPPDPAFRPSGAYREALTPEIAMRTRAAGEFPIVRPQRR